MAEFIQELVIAASPATVFGYLTEADQHLRWEGTEAELDARPGGRYRVLVAGEREAEGEFVEVLPGERVVHTFGWCQPGNPIPPGSSTVEWTLKADGDGTRLRLRHHDLSNEGLNHQTPEWRHYLRRLGIAAEGGDPGPDASDTLYDRVGGQDWFHALVDRFYEGVEDDPVLRPLYPEDLTPGKRGLALFLSQYWGGPPVFNEERGQPRLRARHLPFVIDTPERDAWVRHMSAAVRAGGLNEYDEAALLEYVELAATHMINQRPLDLRPPG